MYIQKKKNFFLIVFSRFQVFMEYHIVFQVKLETLSKQIEALISAPNTLTLDIGQNSQVSKNEIQL